MSKLKCAIVLVFSLLVSCTSLQNKNDSGSSDSSTKPSLLQQKNQTSNKREVVDATTLQTQADYHVTVAELYSFQGRPGLAVENFKSAILYDSKSAWLYYRLAAETVKTGQLDDAKAICDIALKLKPGFSEVRVLRATIFMAEKKYQEAMNEYQVILKNDPQHPESLMYLGAIASEMKEFEKAKNYFTRLSQSGKFANTHLAYYYLGRVAMEEKKKDSFKVALSYFEKSLQERPDFPEAAIAVGQMNLILGNETKAMEHYKAFQKRYGPVVKIAEILSQHYLAKSQYDNAYEQLEILEEESDDQLSAKLKMALILVEKNMLDAAIVKFKEIEKAAPDSDKAKFYLAALYEEKKDFTMAISYFKQVPAESSHYGESIMHLALLYQKTNRAELMASTLLSAIENKVPHPPVYMLYSSYLEQSENFDKALEVMNLAASRFESSAQVQFYIGTLYDKMNEKEKMLTSLRASIELDQSNPQVLNYLAYSLAELNKDLDEAEQWAKKAVKAAPEDPYILDTLGWVQFKKGKNKEAVTNIEKAHRISPDVSVFAEHLAEIYLAKNNELKAREYYIKAYETEEDPQKKDQLKNKIAGIEDRNNIKLVDRMPASFEAESGKNDTPERANSQSRSKGAVKEK